ncbi:MAG: glutamate--tRNA ligase [Chloroflexi bacterium]|nr:glutamate--tRNA ligase [Chloroflexota bacterium]
MTVRVRFAPSPTGYLHVGGLRSAIFNYLFARHYGGKFILRIEDTDRKRFVADSLADILSSFRWMALDWDEGPEVGGSYGPYLQSQRLPIYQEYTQKLIDSGHAYHCYCTPERMETLRQEQMRLKQNPGYDRHCRNLSAAERQTAIAQGVIPVVRLKAPLEGVTVFHDALRGEIITENQTLDDLVLMKSDGYPTYHLANVIDDHLMQITHVLRADEWIPSTPRHVLLYQAFGWEMPVFAHLSLILDPNGKGKMSKRKTVDASSGQEHFVQVREFRQAGYLPEAMLNYLTLLGWSYNDKTEIMSREEFIASFDLKGIKASPAAFSYDKLNWMNGIYIRELPAAELARHLIPFLEQAGIKPTDDITTWPTLLAIIPLVRERLKTLAEAPALVDFFFQEIGLPDPESLQGKLTPAETRLILEQTRSILATLPEFTATATEEALRDMAGQLGKKPGVIFTPVRVAVTGKTVAPPLFGSLEILGRQRVDERLARAIAQFEMPC